MAARIVRGHFDTFAQSRLHFVREIAALAERPDYLEVRDPFFHCVFSFSDVL